MLYGVQVFTETLQNKKVAVEEIEDLADLLRAEDGEKKNGTSDVESRSDTVYTYVYLYLVMVHANQGLIQDSSLVEGAV